MQHSFSSSHTRQDELFVIIVRCNSSVVVTASVTASLAEFGATAAVSPAGLVAVATALMAIKFGPAASLLVITRVKEQPLTAVQSKAHHSRQEQCPATSLRYSILWLNIDSSRGRFSTLCMTSIRLCLVFVPCLCC